MTGSHPVIQSCILLLSRLHTPTHTNLYQTNWGWNKQVDFFLLSITWCVVLFFRGVGVSYDLLWLHEFDQETLWFVNRLMKCWQLVIGSVTTDVEWQISLVLHVSLPPLKCKHKEIGFKKKKKKNTQSEGGRPQQLWSTAKPLLNPQK